MEEITKLQVDWKKIAVVGFLVVLTGLVAAGATWYVLDMSKQAELDVKDEEIATLETENAKLSNPTNEKDATKTTTSAGKSVTEPNSLLTYSNNTYKFSFKYPKGFSYKDGSCTVSSECVHYVNIMSDALSKIEGGPFQISSVSVYPKKGSDLKLWIENTAEIEYAGGLKAITNDYQNGFYFERTSLFDKPNIVYVFSNKTNTQAFVISGFLSTTESPNINNLAKTFNAN